MNRITLRVLLVLLLAAGMVLMAASCKGETAEAAPEAVAAPEPDETLPQGTEMPVTPVSVTEPTVTEPTQTEPQEERFRLTFAGDCTLGANPVNYYAGVGFIKTVGEDYAYPFRNVLSFFENDDFTMVNLEGALCDGGAPVPKTHNFRGPTAYINILTENSVEAVTVANNHTMDYGPQGYASTLAALEGAGIPYVERDASAIVTTESGLTIGLYGSMFCYFDMDAMEADLADLREQGADIIIFATHWGVEYSYRPSTEQVRVAHAAIDAGADIVYGTHPHVLQPIEEYNGGIIYYSLGNFCFGGNSCPDDFDTALLQQEVIRDRSGGVRLGELTIVPASVSSISGRNNYQPTPYEQGTESYDRVLRKLGAA